MCSSDLGADKSVNEGTTVSLNPATFTDNGVLDTHTATIDWGDDTGTQAGTVDQAADTVSGSHVYADDGVYTVTVTVKDNNGGTATDTMKVTVANVAPTVAAGSNQSVAEGTTVSLAPATFNDKGTKDTHTATVDWGDGTGAVAATVTESPFGPPGSTSGVSGTVAGSHVYADDGP